MLGNLKTGCSEGCHTDGLCELDEGCRAGRPRKAEDGMHGMED